MPPIPDDAQDTRARANVERQFRRLREVFTEDELDALCRAGLCDVLAWAVAEGMLRERGTTSDADLERFVAAKKPSPSPVEVGHGTLAPLARVLHLAESVRARLGTADVGEARAIRDEICALFAPRVDLPWAAGPENAILGFVSMVEIVLHIAGMVDGADRETWVAFQGCRATMLDEGTMSARRRAVEDIRSAIENLGEWDGADPLAEAVEALFEEFLEDPALHVLAGVDRDFVKRLLARAAPGGPRAPKAPYVAAALSIQAGAFGDAKEPGESEEGAYRRISNIFRNAANARRPAS